MNTWMLIVRLSKLLSGYTDGHQIGEENGSLRDQRSFEPGLRQRTLIFHKGAIVLALHVVLFD
jgi:hypothetical protein